MSDRLTSIKARMRSDIVSLESPATCSTISAGMSFCCCEKYSHRSANRVLSCASRFWSGGKALRRWSY